ncbi:hypothetical protein SUGI_0047400 [Cryptomeria japonica]|nr:hypothetical protein SUGI_0047400 [Cryptomeria japonica]
MITNAIIKGGSKNWKIDKVVKVIKEHLISFGEFKISHVHQLGNMEADVLLKQAVELNTEIEEEIQEVFQDGREDEEMASPDNTEGVSLAFNGS